MDRFSRPHTWHGVVFKAEKTDVASGGLKLQCIRNCRVLPRRIECRAV